MTKLFTGCSKRQYRKTMRFESECFYYFRNIEKCNLSAYLRRYEFANNLKVGDLISIDLDKINHRVKTIDRKWGQYGKSRFIWKIEIVTQDDYITGATLDPNGLLVDKPYTYEQVIANADGNNNSFEMHDGQLIKWVNRYKFVNPIYEKLGKNMFDSDGCYSKEGWEYYCKRLR